MMKKFLCLCVVLALTGSAGAATAIWNGPTGSAGDWAVGSNWGGSGTPASGNDTYTFRAASTAQSIITVSTTGNAALRFFIGQTNSTIPNGVTATSSDVLLTINAGADLRSGRDTMAYSIKTGSKSVIDIYGTFNPCFASSAGLALNVASGTGAVSTDVVHVRGGGMLNVGTAGTGATQSGTLNIAAVGSGTGTVNIYSNGIANVRTGYAIGANGKLYLENTGKIWIVGNVTGAVSADVLAGKIAPMALPGTTGVAYGYDPTKVLGNAAAGATWVVGVPEPATVVLLGLGSLLFYRKRR